MGSAPVPYGLPKWVDFEWREPAYPGLERHEGETHESFRARVHEKYRKLVLKKERVFVAGKIPPEAIEEVRTSQAATERGKLPDKMLRVYFVWTPSGIKVRWRVQRDHSGVFTEWQGEPLM